MTQKIFSRRGVNEIKACFESNDLNGALRLSIAFDHQDVVAFLLKTEGLEVDVNAPDDNDRTALHYAARFGRLKIINMLAKRKADLNAQDKQRKNPLYYAYEGGKDASVKVLLDLGATPLSPDEIPKPRSPSRTKVRTKKTVPEPTFEMC